MAVEFILISPFIALWYFDYLAWWSAVIIIFTLYWIPKFPIITAMEHLFPSVIFRANHQTQKRIALTFDDVPYTPEGTAHNEIISLLDQHHAKGTFFGILNSEYPASLVHAVKQGHQIANHGVTNSLHAIHSEERLRKEIKGCDEQIKRIYEEANVSLPRRTLYRPGCGVFTRRMMRVAKELNHEIVLASVYPNDPSIPIDFINYCYIINHIGAGDIVVVHDRKWTPGLLRMLLPWLKTNGYSCVTVDELLQ